MGMEGGSKKQTLQYFFGKFYKNSHLFEKVDFLFFFEKKEPLYAACKHVSILFFDFLADY